MCQKCGKSTCCCVKTISKTGPRGPKGSAGPKGSDGKVESGDFTLSADGLIATGGTIGGSGPAPTITISTTGKPKFIQFNVQHNISADIGSIGKDDTIKQDCMYSNDAPGVALNQGNSIFVVNAAIDGFYGKVTAFNGNNFVISLNKSGAGLPIKGRWHALTS